LYFLEVGRSRFRDRGRKEADGAAFRQEKSRFADGRDSGGASPYISFSGKTRMLSSSFFRTEIRIDEMDEIIRIFVASIRISNYADCAGWMEDGFIQAPHRRGITGHNRKTAVKQGIQPVWQCHPVV
jgi:hypothetical protein